MIAHALVVSPAAIEGTATMAHAIAAQNQSIQPPTHAPASRGSSCLHEKRAQTGAVLFRMCLANPDPGKGRRVRQRLLGFCADRIYLGSLYLECSASLHLLQSMHELDEVYALKLYTWTSDAFINVETLLCFPTIHRWTSSTTPWTQPRRYALPSLIARGTKTWKTYELKKTAQTEIGLQ